MKVVQCLAWQLIWWTQGAPLHRAASPCCSSDATHPDCKPKTLITIHYKDRSHTPHQPCLSFHHSDWQQPPSVNTALSACSHTAQEKRLRNKHCNNIGAFLQSQNLGMLKPWLELYCALQRLGCDLPYYQEYLSTGSRDLCRVSAASTDRGKTMGAGSYKCCSKVFFICLFQMDNTR